MKNSTLIIGVQISCFSKQAEEVQRIFTDYGCSIRTRVGLHNVADGLCSLTAVILIEFIGTQQTAEEMIAKLTAIDGVVVKTMTF